MQLEDEHAKLRPDLEVVRTYGEAHPDVWVGLRFENDPPVRIVALFSGEDIQEHEAALRSLVDYPGQLEVNWSPWPLSHLEDIRAQVHQMATTGDGGAFREWGIGQGNVTVRLKSNQETLAAELHERYGDAVDLTVGYFHYPDLKFLGHDGMPGPPPVPQRPALLASDEIEVSVEEDLKVKSGEDLSSVLRVRNHQSAEIVVLTNGMVTAHIVDPETDEVVGAFDGARRLPLVPFRIPPHDFAEIPMLIGTASTAPRLGYAVPPGRWTIEVILQLEDRGSYRTPLLPIIVE